jgi:hypothetical protein
MLTLEQSVIDVVKFKKDVAGLSEKDATVIRLGRALLREHKVSHQLGDGGLPRTGKASQPDHPSIVHVSSIPDRTPRLSNVDMLESGRAEIDVDVESINVGAGGQLLVQGAEFLNFLQEIRLFPRNGFVEQAAGIVI